MKKAYELSILCECEIGIIIFDSHNNLYTYADNDINNILQKCAENTEPYELLTNTDIIEVKIVIKYIFNLIK